VFVAVVVPVRVNGVIPPGTGFSVCVKVIGIARAAKRPLK
jgi:hypothetical protein